ncbi:hypothetical protein GCK32_011212 [Trichostrongylus colubriformis]|uniref:Uncharacterized protein n=1 Tax=Trichostrongylus colubriformis TaxID=6319 RepID=A0AAN8FVD8_TRICO
MNSCDDALRGVVRNIPIHVQGPEKKTTDTFVAEPVNYGTLNGGPFRRRLSESGGSDLLPVPREVRRAMSSGRLSPTDTTTHPKNSTSQPLLTSDDDERRSLRSDVTPHRTLVIPSSIPGGKTIEIPLGSVSLTSSRQDLSSSRNDRDRSPKPESQMEKLTQRLKNLGE